MNHAQNAHKPGPYLIKANRPGPGKPSPMVHVLSVGPIALSNMVRDVMMARKNCRLSIATDYRELWVFPASQTIDVALLHSTLFPFELEDACQFIRHRWPRARILVVRSQDESLDDALYDDRLLPAAFPTGFMACIEQLTDARNPTGETMAARICRACSGSREK